KIPVTLHALYRGQHVVRELSVERPPPTITMRHAPGPDKVAFAARMEKSAYGAISIVLDTSGSMKWRHPMKFPKNKDDLYPVRNKGEKSRYDFATAAVESVLQEIPNKTFLSMFLFAPEKGNNNSVISMIREPKRWNSTEDRPQEIKEDLLKRSL